MAAPLTTLVVPDRARGPRTSGNGGWSAGALAGLVSVRGADGWPATTVQLRQPPPLDTPLEVGEVGAADGWTTASHDGQVVLRARPAAADPEPVPGVDPATARAAEASYPGLVHHPFPSCYVCGTVRDDGLRVFAGPVEPVDGAVRVAATWTPASEDLEDTWAALDCPGAWSLDAGERLLVLGQMTARVHRLPEAGAEHVVVGLAGPTEGRKHHSRTSLWTAGGELLATTDQVWFTIDPKDFA